MLFKKVNRDDCKWILKQFNIFMLPENVQNKQNNMNRFVNLTLEFVKV